MKIDFRGLIEIIYLIRKGDGADKGEKLISPLTIIIGNIIAFVKPVETPAVGKKSYDSGKFRQIQPPFLLTT